MRAVVTVTGKDNKGIIAKVSGFLSEKGANIEDISQTIMQLTFTMIMLVDISKSGVSMQELKENLKVLGEEIGVSIHLQHEEVFDAMHRV